MQLLLAFILLPLAAAAQTLPTEFPTDAQAVPPETLRQLFSGKVRKAQPASGAGFRLEYKENGFVFLDTATGFRDTGKWSVEGSHICTDFPKLQKACNEARVQGDTVFVRRNSGEILALTPG